ncbi:MAG: glycosyltransferase [Intestinibacter sp.]
MVITVFSDGNARDLQTWSNVPYYTVKALEKRGHTVNCVNLEEKTVIINKFIKAVNHFLRYILGKETMFLVNLWPIMDYLYDYKVKKALEKYSDTEVLLFFSYSLYGNRVSKIPSILFCDFTIEYNIHYIQKRKEKWYEKSLIKHQDKIMKNAYRIVSLFPKAAEHYEEYYNRHDIRRIKGHIINCDRTIYDKDTLIMEKGKSETILFIGRKSYKTGAICLINAIKKYNFIYNTKLQLVIIGMNRGDLDLDENDISFLKCYGILNKMDDNQYDLFYKLIDSAKLIVNTTKNWGGISSIVEAMYLYTPVITSPYDEFVEIFGKNIDFGRYCKAEDEKELILNIKEIFSLSKKEYIEMALNARKAVEGYTWNHCIEMIIDK